MLKSLSRSVICLLIFDLIVLCASSLLFYKNFNLPNNHLIISTILIVVTGIITLYLKGNYKIREFNNTFKNAYLLFEAVIFSQIPVSILLFFINKDISSVKFVCANIITLFVLLKLYRVGLHYYLFNFKKIKKVVIIGLNDKTKTIIDVINKKYALKMEVVGLLKSAQAQRRLLELDEQNFHFERTQQDEQYLKKLENDENNFGQIDLPIFEDGKQIHDVVTKTNADIVVYTHKTALLSAVPRNIKLMSAYEFYELATGKFYIEQENIDELAEKLFFGKSSFSSAIYNFCKRAFDIISALIILIVTLPVTAYIALRVKMIDGGSPFFTQTRVGKNGKTFECFKLRTMYINDYVPKDGNVKYSENIKSDDRIIPFCKFVRKARFDEIPQMINILKGEMSIVGPRAEWEKEVTIFKKEIPFYECRMWVKTGWTGWSHINMKPVFNIEDEKERLAHDLYYIKHRNVLWEIGILVKAVFLAVGGRHE